MTNELVINGADIKFSYFLDKTDLVPREYHKESWYIKMRELDAVIHNSKMQDKITFTDERLILIAYKIMTETNMFDEVAKVNEWWIVYRYIQLYGQNLEGIEKLSEFVNMYMGFSFTKAVMDEKSTAKFTELANELSTLLYDDGPLQPFKIPDFVTSVVNTAIGGEVEPVSDWEDEEEVDFSDARVRFEGLKETAEMMLRMDINDSEKEKWQGAFDTAEMMLRNLEQ